jgi:hypothetical protein
MFAVGILGISPLRRPQNTYHGDTEARRKPGSGDLAIGELSLIETTAEGGCATQVSLGVNRASRVDVGMNGGWGWWIAKSPELPKIAEIVNLTWVRKLVAHAKPQRSRFLTRSLRSGYSK